VPHLPAWLSTAVSLEINGVEITTATNNDVDGLVIDVAARESGPISVAVLMHDAHMTESDDFSIDCKTCIGAGTTACNDCIVTHLLANSDGPIDYVPVQLAPVQRRADPNDVAIDLFRRAGLLDDPIQFVPVDEFEAHGRPINV